MRYFAPIILIVLTLAGCTLNPAQNTSLVSNTATFQSSLPSETPTRTPRPTLTSKPTVTETRIRPTIPVATLNARATLEPLEALCDEFDTDSDRSSAMSPNGEWFAIRCGYKRNQKLIVQNLEGTKWVLDFATLLRPKIEGMTGTFEPLAWSSDGKFLYLSKVLGYSGGGSQCFPRFGDYGLYRLHLQSGTLVTLVFSRDDEFPSDKIVFSPTNDFYAVAHDGISITNLVSGEVTNIHVSGVIEMTWSPDGKFLVFSIASCGEEFVEESFYLVESSSLFVWDSSTNQSRILFSSDMLLRPESWVDSSTLEFQGEKWGNDHYLYTNFEYDLVRDKMLISSTPTPRP